MRFLPEFGSKLRYVRERLSEKAVRALPLSTLDVRSTRPIVSFTFDDVPETALTQGARILEENGVRGTFYIAGSLLGLQEPQRRLISQDGCKALADAGHEIGCHSFGHNAVHRLSRRALMEDLNHNALVLEDIDGSSNKRNFAYPYNQGSLRHRRIFDDGYTTARGGGDRINRGRVNRSYLWGMEIRQPESDALSLVHQIDAAIARPGWLIFFTHDISDSPTSYGCSPAAFARLVAHAVSSGCLVLPVREALRHIEERACE